jgi:hypothetical protein
MRAHCVLAALLATACGASMSSPDAASSRSVETASPAPSSAPDASASLWRTFTYAPGVTVEMPGTPIDAGVAHVFVLKRADGRGLSVQCSDGGTAQQRAETLAGMRRGVIGARKLVSEKKVARGSAKGVELDVVTETTAGTTHLRVLLLAGDGHACTFTSIVSGSAPDTETDRFLASALVE